MQRYFRPSSAVALPSGASLARPRVHAPAVFAPRRSASGTRSGAHAELAHFCRASLARLLRRKATPLAPGRFVDFHGETRSNHMRRLIAALWVCTQRLGPERTGPWPCPMRLDTSKAHRPASRSAVKLILLAERSEVSELNAGQKHWGCWRRRRSPNAL